MIEEKSTRGWLTTKELRHASDICRSAGAIISFTYSGEGSGVDCADRKITIDLNEATTIEWFWSLVFHELAHIYCYDNNIYRTYHHDTLSGNEMLAYARKMSLRIERYVDNLGKKNMKKFFPGLKFERSYDNIEDINWLKSWVEVTYGT